MPTSSSSSSLVRALAACFEADPLIDEYDFVPLLAPLADDDAAASSFLVESHKLAISAAAIKPLFREAHAAFQATSTAEEDAAGAAAAGGLIDVTRALVLVNPDVYTAWNARKRLIAAGTISAATELAFVDLVFSKHTKKACAWAHRRWCLARLRADADADADDADADAQESHELRVTASICERFPKNYYAWTHRWWVAEAGAARRRERGAASVKAWLGAQVAFGEAWVERHVWDMSAAAFLHHALRAWAREWGEEEGKEGVVLGRVRGMLRAGARKLDQCPGHESLWYLRRGLLAVCVERQAAQQRGAPVALPAPPSTEVPAPYPTPPSPEDDAHHVGSLLAWEVRMAEYYRRGEGPFHVEAGAGLLWEEAARRRQRVCAWAYARWLVEVGLRHGVLESSSSGGGGGSGGGSTGEGWAEYLGEALGGLGPTGGGLFVPPGYGALVEQLG